MTNDNNRITDLQSYPILTEEVGSTPARRTGGTGTRLDQIIESALQEILGWRPRTGDPKGFVAALTQSFSLEEQEGHKKWTWTPHAYAIQADLGAVTGAQASIYARARVVLDESLPLLEGLKSLLPDADPEDTEASKAIIESSLTELVNEMGLVGGPRVQRVDSYFKTLLGGPRDLKKPKEIEDDPEKVAGQLGTLRDRLGLDRGRVNTVVEEQNLTDFRILVDYIVALQRSWDSQKRFFKREPRGTDVFLGTQLVLLSRELAVLAESVQEAYFAMDSVFLRDAERQAAPLDLGTNQPALTIAELLDWIDRFATDEGPRLIREAGKDGVIAFRSTVDQLKLLVEKALNPPDENNLPAGFLTPRVQRTFKELKQHLEETKKLANQLKRDPPPLVGVVDPDSGVQDQTVQVHLYGENFQHGATVTLRQYDDEKKPTDEIDASSVKFLSAALLRAEFDLAEAMPGIYSVIVTNRDEPPTESPRTFEVKKVQLTEATEKD